MTDRSAKNGTVSIVRKPWNTPLVITALSSSLGTEKFQYPSADGPGDLYPSSSVNGTS